MAFLASNPLHQQTKLYSITLCKCTWPLNFFKFHYSPSLLTFSPPKHPLQQSLSPLLEVRTHGGHIVTELSTADQEISNNSSNDGYHIPVASGTANDKRVRRKNAKKNVSSVDEENLEMGATKDGDTGKRLDSRKRSEKSFAFSYLWSKRETIVKSLTENIGSTEDNTERVDKSWKGFGKELGVEKRKKGVKRSKVYSREVMLRVGLDRCSKKGDVMGALMLYDSARREGVVMEQYHYTVLLYLCSSAATGDVRPAKSGTVTRSLSNLDPTTEVSTLNSEDLGNFDEYVNQWVPSDIIDRDYNGLPPELGNEMGRSFDGKKLAMVYNGDTKPNPQVMDGTIHRGIGGYKIQVIEDGKNPETFDIPVNTSFKDYALLRGFEIFERMCLEEVPINEASLTSVARMYMALRDGDMAFFMVKQMKPRGINPRLRSYGPALSAFCNCGDVDKAFSVEQHMLEHGVYPEEQELEALLKVSVEAGRSDKVYYLLHKLRTSVRKVSPSVVDLLEKWFKSKVASKVGKRKLDERLIREAIENGGGGWHGQGWLGKGKWNVLRTFVGADGLCKCCGEKLATVDLDPVETEKFAESVASIAEERDKNSSFQRFKKWLDYHGPFEAVVDGANIGVLAKRKLNSSQQARLQMVTKVNAIVNGIRQLLPSKKWPLIVLHTRHITGYNWDKPLVKELIEKWKTAGALYVTPNGLYDDWYWLYAAIKCKGLLVTNDEMRDHLFQLLGNDFFPKWKERHQVRFSFSDAGPVIHMPPPYSVVIQESEKGHWHIPIASEHDNEGERTWLCITRGNSPGSTQVTAAIHEDNRRPGPTKLSATIHDEHNDLAGATQVTGTIHEESQSTVRKRGCESSANPTKIEAKSMLSNHGNQSANGNSKHSPEELYESLVNILSTPLSSTSKDSTILPQIEAAEKLGRCVIDFEI